MVVYRVQERGSSTPSRESRALSSAWASLRPKTTPVGPERSWMRLRPTARTRLPESVTAAPMGREPAR